MLQTLQCKKLLHIVLAMHVLGRMLYYSYGCKNVVKVIIGVKLDFVRITGCLCAR